MTSPHGARHDPRRLVDEAVAVGRHEMQQGAFSEAIPHLHAASWTAARSGLMRERLDVQVRLGDAQLQARQFQAALASYRFAEELAEAVAPDSADYWAVRASIAQALRRTGQIEEAREECTAVRERLACGTLAPPDGRTRLVHVMASSLHAQLDAMTGDFRAAADEAVDLAESLLRAGDSVRGANQLFNAALWLLFACDRAAHEWRTVHERAMDYGHRSIELIAHLGGSPDDERRVESGLLIVLGDLFLAKLARRDGLLPEAQDASLRARDALEQLQAERPAAPALRFQIAIIRLRLAERLPDAGASAALRREVVDLLRTHRPESELWVRQDLGARFHWDRQVVPLGSPDPDLERLLVEATA